MLHLGMLELQWVPTFAMSDSAGDLRTEGRRLLARERARRGEERLLLSDDCEGGNKTVPLRHQIAAFIDDGTLPPDWMAASER
mmetsp:Transcript_34995/g.99347  ORF Transcript_34995/g.99347 Transcript_34995/m.99347 type:complete len:83 (+) Transcript_34995:482-730(+)